MDRSGTLVSPVIVGRDDLLQLADRRLAQVAEGRGHLLLAAGEAGIGKTRLLHAIEHRAQAAGFQIARGGTYPTDLHVAAAILVDLARNLRRTPALDAIGAELASRLDAPDSQGGDAHRRRRLLVLDIADTLSKLSMDGPCLLLLEDLHWSDDLTLEVLAALARLLPDIPLLVIGTYRSDELYPRVPMRDWRARLLQQRLAEEVRLQRLSVEETATMVNAITAARVPVPTTVAKAIHTRTDGVPLYIEEFLSVLVAAGFDAADVEMAVVPDTIEDTLVARVDRCSSPAAALARAGAVIGRAFDVDMLSAVVEQAPEQLSEPLGELADHFILLPTRTGGRLGFRHALICDAIYDRIPEPERRRLHARTADAAVDRPDVGTEAFLSLHFERAGRREEAFRAALAGAHEATQMSSHGEARELYHRALRTAPASLPDGERAELLQAYGASLMATDQNEAANDAFEQARALYLRAGRTLDAAAVVEPLVAVRHLLGDGLDARTGRLRAALKELDAPPSLHQPPSTGIADRIRGRLLAGLSAAYMLDRRLDESISYGTEARRLAAAAGDGSTERHASATLGSCLVFSGRMDDGWGLLEEAVARSREQHLESDAARAYRMLGSCASVLVEYERAESWLRDGIDYAERVALWNHRHYMAAHLGHVLWATGRWVEAETIARAALADGRGGVTTRITALHVLGFVALGRGSWAAAREALSEARDLGERMRELQRLSPAVWGLAEMAWLTGDADEGIALAERGLAASAEVTDGAYLFPFLVTGTRLHLAAGDPLAAARWVDEAGALVARRAIPGTLPAINHARALIELADGNTGVARTTLESVASAWSRLGRVWEGTWARIDLARCHIRANHHDNALQEARMALDAAARLGSPPLDAAAHDVEAAAARHRTPDEPWAPLTAREFEVARLVTEGMTNPEVARELGLSPKTVSAHLEHIMGKLGVNRRAEVAAWVASTRVLHSVPHGRDREE